MFSFPKVTGAIVLVLSKMISGGIIAITYTSQIKVILGSLKLIPVVTSVIWGAKTLPGRVKRSNLGAVRPYAQRFVELLSSENQLSDLIVPPAD